jgi:hypothetical protein
MTITKRKANEVATKEVEEEQQKRDEEALNNDASPMDTDLLESSMEVPSSQPQFSGMELGLHTPYKPSKVSNLKKFRYDKATGQALYNNNEERYWSQGETHYMSHREHCNRGFHPRSTLHSIRWHFLYHNHIEQNLKKLYRQNQEKDARIRELEEQLRQVRIDEGNLQEFKACAEKVRNRAGGSHYRYVLPPACLPAVGG